MRLLNTLLALYSSLRLNTFLHISALSHNITLTFDSLPPALRISPLPSPYNNLNFSSFSVFAPRSPLLKDYITPYDLNCAVSKPNALIGSRAAEGGPGASFEVASASTMIEESLEPHFALLSLQLKPMAAPEPGTKVWIKGFHLESEDVLYWEVEFPSGFHLPLLVDIAKFSKKSWDRLYKVEIGADFGYDALDWEFCLDDLKLQFTERPDQVWGHGTANEKVMHND